MRNTCNHTVTLTLTVTLTDSVTVSINSNSKLKNRKLLHSVTPDPKLLIEPFAILNTHTDIESYWYSYSY